MLTKSGSVTHIVHMMKRVDFEVFSSELSGDRDDFNVTPTMIVRQFYEFRKAEVRSIFKSHFGLFNAFNVEFYGGSRQRKATMSFVSLPSMRSSPTTPSPPDLTRSPTVEHMSDMMMAYFNGDGMAGDGGDLSAEEKKRTMMEMVDRLFMEQKRRKQMDQQIAVEAVSMGHVLEEEAKEQSPEAMTKQEVVEMMEMMLKMSPNAQSSEEDGADSLNPEMTDQEGDVSQSTKL